MLNKAHTHAKSCLLSYCNIWRHLVRSAWRESGGETAMDSAPPFPVPSKTFSAVISGYNTELVVCGYDDFIFVMATQIGKLGTLIHAKKEESYGGASSYNVNVLMGKREEPLLVACARQLIQNISDSGSSRPLVVALGLKDHSQDTLKKIIDEVLRNKVW